MYFVWMDENYSNLLNILPATDHAVAKDLTKPWCPANKQNRLLWKITTLRIVLIYTGWWLQPCFIFHFIYGVILLIDFHIVQDG